MRILGPAAIALLLSPLQNSAVNASSKPVLRYKTCGDLSSQINGHVSAISGAVRNEQDVEIVDAFVVDENVKSTVPLSSVIDTGYLVETIWDLGIDAKIVQPDITTLERLPCYEAEHLAPEAGSIASAVLRAIRPSEQLKVFSDSITGEIEKSGLDSSEGVCLHRPGGSKCNSWGPDGIQRGNCLTEPGKQFIQSLQSRALTSGKRWVYYVGDADAPQELTKSNHKVVTKFDLMEKKLAISIQARFPSFPLRTMQNVWSLIDAFVCRSLPYFVGNSTNDWSALQIALHQLDSKPTGGAYWYNSQNIALAETLPVYHIPIVYTYTELSAGAGKHLMKASLTSVKAQMPRSQIHVIYHGNDDVEFRSWLAKKGAVIHQHDPAWRGSIETMRKNGDPLRSHLFLHEGSYFGTWQRVDIPKFIEAEYCLLLDADTIVVKPFTMKDFGRDITKGLAFSAEADPYLILPWNAGISLMNVPFLRESHSSFIEFILQHVNGEPYDPDAPSDQGAYLDFYKGHVDFLSIDFNFKPYFQVKPFEAARKKILHFHGPKPHHYIGHFMGLPCDAAAQSLCDAAGASPFLCDTVSEFARNLLRSGDDSPEAYCSGVYHGESTRAKLCSFLLERLGKAEGRCRSLSHELQEAQLAFDIAHPPKIKTYQDPGVGEYRYNVCNGLSNQLVYHTLGIAEAIKQKRPVAIFDTFIFNGVQSSDDNVLPTAANSIPLANVVDIEYLFGVIADYGIDVKLVPSDWDLPKEERAPCSGMVPVGEEQSQLASDLLSAFRPSGILKDLILSAKESLKVKGFDTSQGVCVHHRDGQDWHDHCARWGSIPDGIYRGNCLNETHQPFLVSLENRALRNDSRWIYYVGDHEVPKELAQSKYTVVTKHSFLDAEAKTKLADGVLQSKGKPDDGSIRDLWSIIDFFVCDSLNFFVGNSVSSWSAVQVAVRQKDYRARGVGTYWYNSQSIPLGDFLPLYEVPVAFVYSELSTDTTRFLLQASITSVKEHMSRSRITVLYHGDEDLALRSWLERKGVIIEQHYPEWRSDVVEASATPGQLRPRESSTQMQEWQRIDIPKYVESEYCLFLEPGFLVRRRFTLADFGLNLTWSIAFLPQTQSTSSESSGISLLNIPKLRKTYKDFLGFVGHKKSVRAAYDLFYKDTVQTLPHNFAFQPHETIARREAASSNAVFFYDVKPHQYFGHAVGAEYGEITAARCRQAMATSQLCRSVQEFSRLLLQSGEPGLLAYCKASFPDSPRHRHLCALVFNSLAAEDGHCDDLQHYVKHTVALARKTGRLGSQNINKTVEASWIDTVSAVRYSNATNALVLYGLFGLLAMLLSRRRFGRKFTRHSGARHLRLWTALNIVFSLILGHILINGVVLHRYTESQCP